MPNLDWEKVFAANAGIPELRVFHNIANGVCERCGLEVFEDPCANGHTLVSYDEIPATTEAEGKKAYDECSICHKLFIGGVEVTAEQLVIPMIKDYDIWEYDAQIQGSYDDKFIVNNEGDGTEANPYIIYTAEQLASVTAARIKDANGATVDTAGLYFKVDDNIKAFYMNGGKAIAELKSAAEVKAYFEATPGTAWWVSGNFKGNFDGNGATVYGLYATKENAGLFQNLGAGSVIKNIAVKNSYFSASNGNAGAIAGQVQWYNGIGDGTHTFENCISQNNYFAATDSAGAIIGHSRENKIIMTNCLVADNEFAGEAYLVGNSWNGSNSISNTIVINGLVYGNNNSLKKAEIFSNVYTNVEQTGEGVPEFIADQVTVLTDEAMTMDNMPGLDWDNDWAYVGSPELRVFHNFVATDNGDGTHTEVCECGLATAAQKHIFVNGECVVCENKCLHSNVGEAQVENFVDATCVSAGSYDTVTYCTDCGCEISRETTTIEINPDAHAFDSDADKDCNNGCGLVRVCYGDSDGDGEINNKDIAAIMQHINGWDTEIDETAADVNRDGKINNKDYALLMQYVNGWEVSIG
ncbi:MAG: hypothetical protein E7521_08280 [Ruminococcaceae bacterium]|nr:hypothetical protein [Oscillospiraceae bacterium]